MDRTPPPGTVRLRRHDRLPTLGVTPADLPQGPPVPVRVVADVLRDQATGTVTFRFTLEAMGYRLVEVAHEAPDDSPGSAREAAEAFFTVLEGLDPDLHPRELVPRVDGAEGYEDWKRHVVVRLTMGL